MSRKPSKHNDASNAGNEDTAASFVSLLDNEDVIAKLAQVLSASLQLIFDEKINPVIQRLDAIIKDNKALNDRIAAVEKENDKVRIQNDGLAGDVKLLKSRINVLEQVGRKNNIIINGVAETFAERVTDHDDAVPIESREDTIKSVCTVVAEACGVTITPTDIQSAYRLKTRRPGPRPILVSFNSYTTRQSVVKSRRPRQKLTFRGTPVYINDHLTEINAELSRKARDLVKKHEAFATWTNEGRVFIKWSENSRPSNVQSLGDLSD